jgi:hypothetical protein
MCSTLTSMHTAAKQARARLEAERLDAPREQVHRHARPDLLVALDLPHDVTNSVQPLLHREREAVVHGADMVGHFLGRHEVGGAFQADRERVQRLALAVAVRLLGHVPARRDTHVRAGLWWCYAAARSMRAGAVRCAGVRCPFAGMHPQTVRQQRAYVGSERASQQRCISCCALEGDGRHEGGVEAARE